MGFPPWIIGIVILFLIISLSITVYFVFRKKVGKKRTAVGAQDEEAIIEKRINNPSSTAYPAITPLYNIASSQNSSHLSSKNGLQNNHSSSTIPTTVPSSPYTATSAKSIDERKSMKEHKNTSPTATSVQLSNSAKDDTSSVEMDDSASYQPKPSFTAESPKINLPLPPPSSSFFADKMELDSTEAHDLYQAYLSASQNQDFASVDLEEGSKLSLANIQQKAAHFRSSIYQSLRRKSIYNKSPPIGQFLDSMSGTDTSSIKSPTKSPVESARMSRQSSSTSSSRILRQPHNFLPPSPRPDSPAASESFAGKSSSNSSKRSLIRPSQSQDEEPHSNKIMIDTLPHESYFSLPMTPITPSPVGMKSRLVIPSTGLNVTDYSNVVDEINQYGNDTDELKDQEEEEDDIVRESEDSKHSQEEDQSDMDSAQKAASAARKLIRSASRKSKTLSMIVTDEDAQAMFTSMIQGEDMPSAPDASNITKYATVRGNKKQPMLQKIDTFSDSVRIKQDKPVVDIKKWTAANTSVSEQITSTISSKTVSGLDTVSGKQSIRIRNQLKNVFSSETTEPSLDTKELRAGTIGRKFDKPSPTKESTSLKDLFSQPPNKSENSDATVAKQGVSQKELALNRPLSIVTMSSEADILNRTTTPSSPITVESLSPYASKNNTLQKAGNNVDAIRKMLQSSWSGNNIKGSLSNSSLASSSGDKSNRSSAYMGSIGSSYRPVASPVGSVNPRLQNQHLISLSLRASNSQFAARSRPSMPTDFMNEGEEGPTPTVSFSTSTVQTMIPAEDVEEPKKKPQQKKSVMGNLLGSRQNNKTRQPSKLGAGLNKQQGKTPAQIEREKYLKSLGTQ